MSRSSVLEENNKEVVQSQEDLQIEKKTRSYLSEYDDEEGALQRDLEEVDQDLELENKQTYLEEIKKFRMICKKKQLDIKPSWSEANIPELSTNRLENEIYASRIIYLMQRTLDKIKIIGYLPYFMQNDAEIIRKYTQRKKADCIIKKLTGIPHEREKVKFQTKKHTTIVGGILDPETELVLNMLTKNECLSMYCKQTKLPLDPFIKDLLITLRSLLKIMMSKLKMSAEEERNKEAMLKIKLRDFKERTETIKRLKNKLLEQEEETNKKIEVKNKAIEGYKTTIGELKAVIQGKIDAVVIASDRRMMNVVGISRDKQANLLVESKEAVQCFEKLLDTHLNDEKKHRAKRIKIEAQLATWVAKFDQDMAERQEVFDEVQEGFDIEQQQFAELECLFIEQEKLYSEYKAQKDEEDEELFNEILYKFVAGRSARIIQRAWRAYRARKLARRKARKAKDKKGKKKK